MASSEDLQVVPSPGSSLCYSSLRSDPCWSHWHVLAHKPKCPTNRTAASNEFQHCPLLPSVPFCPRSAGTCQTRGSSSGYMAGLRSSTQAMSQQSCSRCDSLAFQEAASAYLFSAPRISSSCRSLTSEVWARGLQLLAADSLSSSQKTSE